MKKILFLLILVVLLSPYINAQLVLEENFNYPAGDSLGLHGWVSFSGGNTNYLNVVSPGLTYTNYPSSGIGNAARVLNFGQDAYKEFSDTIASNSAFLAFMVKIDSAKTGDYFLAFLPSNSTTFYTGRVYAKDSAGGIAFGVSKSSSSSGPVVYTPAVYQYNTTYLLVLKYKFISGTNTDDETSLFVFTSPALPTTEPSVPTVGPVLGTVNDAVDLYRVALRQGSSSSSPTLFIDGIRATKSWGNIVTSLKNISINNPENFKLFQNYPNPFNPTTIIKFSLPVNGFVNLKIYDMLGKEIQTLVSRNLSSGTYEYNYSSKSLISGVYFYKLDFSSINGNNFSEIRKMVLVK